MKQKRLTLTFKNNEEEYQLYKQILKHSCPTAWIKDVLKKELEKKK